MTKVEFKNKLDEIITPYIASYNEGVLKQQPIYLWERENPKPTFAPKFWEHLPPRIRTTIEVMMDQITE